MLIPKRPARRDQDWLDHLKTLPCRRCAGGPCDPAHLGHSSMSMKSDDAASIPLCRKCHRDFDTCPNGKEWWVMNEIMIPEAVRAYHVWREAKCRRGVTLWDESRFG